ncbi:hypothetical protein SAMN06265795_101327 [Noviherbaspirillum humi]|uniref:CobW/HypB/UreG, nucleotide-binding domain n=1 Tax=Noviherbaspirillum humi TaxID=1688639 RepID=A0A239C8W3_9BURK|nr:GTPase [Noviherbaspirillum humi]SNS16686.1 hypothetical protein SAMN06265795_101327 [Noviherbaspirillum humi]
MREQKIADHLPQESDTAILIEGLPYGSSALDGKADREDVYIARIAPGCICCSGNLTMRVTLNRLLRRKPGRLFISLANAEHLASIRAFLTAPPYDQLLDLTEDIMLQGTP